MKIETAALEPRQERAIRIFSEARKPKAKKVIKNELLPTDNTTSK